MKKVLIPTKLNKVAAEVLTANGNYQVIQDESVSLEDLAGRHKDAYALIVRSEKVSPEVIDMLPELKVIVRAGAGFNTIDIKYARKRGIDVMNTPGANSNAVAEEVIAMMLADARHIVKADMSTRQGKWEKKRFMGREISGKVVGIVGLGYIGRLLAKRLSGFDLRLIGYDPFITRSRAEEINVELKSINEIFAEADYVSLHIPENEETRGMVNKELLSLMKPGATIVNCARAGIIDEAAVREAKKEKEIRFLNDVYTKDGKGEKTVADIADLMLPHLGASTREANFNAARRAAEELIDLEDKGITSFIVNREIPEGLDEEYCRLANTLARLARSFIGKETPIKQIGTKVYGSLEPFAEWLLVPVASGIWEDFDSSMDFRATLEYLEDMGIEYLNRRIDPAKKYGNSITIDITYATDAENLRNIIIRGTVAEGFKMVSRINEFNKLYFEPVGHTLFVLYDDRPGVIGAIGSTLAKAGINIENMRNLHETRTNRSLAILKVNKEVSKELLAQIKQEVSPLAGFSIHL